MLGGNAGAGVTHDEDRAAVFGAGGDANLGSFTSRTSFNLLLGARTTFGSAAAPADRFWGMLDESSLYNRALTEAEIRQISLADQTGKCPGLPTLAQAIETLQAEVTAKAPKPRPLAAALSAGTSSRRRNTNWRHS
jgi:hypothetical protein